MRMKTFDWLGHEFVAVSCDAPAGAPADHGMDGILSRIEAGIGRLGLSLADSVRTRLWARDRSSRSLASQARSRRMRGSSRSSSSSYIAPGRFDSDATVALDFVAMRSSGEKRLAEYDPPSVPLRYLDLEGMIFLSGVTATRGKLAEQVREACGLIGESLEHAGASWEQATLVSFFLQQNEEPESMRAAFERVVGSCPAGIECSFVEGYSAQGKLIEIEVTAHC